MQSAGRRGRCGTHTVDEPPGKPPRREQDRDDGDRQHRSRAPDRAVPGTPDPTSRSERDGEHPGERPSRREREDDRVQQRVDSHHCAGAGCDEPDAEGDGERSDGERRHRFGDVPERRDRPVPHDRGEHGQGQHRAEQHHQAQHRPPHPFSLGCGETSPVAVDSDRGEWDLAAHRHRPPRLGNDGARGDDGDRGEPEGGEERDREPSRCDPPVGVGDADERKARRVEGGIPATRLDRERLHRRRSRDRRDPDGGQRPHAVAAQGDGRDGDDHQRAEHDNEKRGRFRGVHAADVLIRSGHARRRARTQAATPIVTNSGT